MTNKRTSYTATEQEAVVLNSVWSAIDEMVNYEMFVKSDAVNDVTLLFNTMSHTRLFNILLGDFLARPQPRGDGPMPFGLSRPPKGGRLTDGSHLFYLREIARRPLLGPDVGPLASLVEAFSRWLEADSVVEKVWFGSIDLEADLKMPRIRFLRVCADIGKHNVLRLEGTVRSIRQILESNGHTVDDTACYMAMEDFYKWYHRDIFIYHSSAIAEFLNNIRWAIFDYLSPEFGRAYRRHSDELIYRFDVPPECVNPLGRSMYWDLMNKVRARPYFRRFSVTDVLKLRY